MAALTWREVAAPNFSNANDMLRISQASSARAMDGLQNLVKGLQTQQQAGVDNSILTRAMQIQDPQAMRQALTSGSLLQGVDLSKVNPRVLESVNSRVGQLLNQAATQQGIDATALNMRGKQYDLDRTQSQDRIEDSARSELAASLGLSGPLAQLSTQDQQGIAKTQSGLASDRLSRQGMALSNEARAFNNMTTRRDDAAGQSALTEVGSLLQRNATTDDLRRDFEETPFATPQARAIAQQQLERATGQRLYAPLDADVPNNGTKGGAPTGSGGAGQPATMAAQAALQDIGRRTSQNNSAGIVADIEKNLADTRSAPEVAKALAENLPEADQGKINGLITRAMSQNPGLSAADIGSAIQRSTSGNWLGTTGIADGVGVDDQMFQAVLKDLSTGKADYNSVANQRARKAGNAISKADENLSNAIAELARQRQRANSQTGIDTSRAQEKVSRMEQALNSAIREAQEVEFQPQYVTPPKPNERRRGERGRANNQRP